MNFRLELTEQEISSIVSLLRQVPTGQALDAGMAHLVPKIMAQVHEQANVVNPHAASDNG
jgi:hypothetical protein